MTTAPRVQGLIGALQVWLAAHPTSPEAPDVKALIQVLGTPATVPAPVAGAPLHALVADLAAVLDAWETSHPLTPPPPPPPPPPPVPVVTSVTPNTGVDTGGTTVSVAGSGFTGATAVDFGTAPASFSVVSDAAVSAVSPAGADAAVDVTVTTPGGVSTTSAVDRFTYTPPPPPPPPPPPGLPPLWNAAPPAGVCAAPSGPYVGVPGDWAYGIQTTTEVFDNFDGPAGSAINQTLWQLDSINQGGNQTYDPSTDRVYLDGDSNVVLKATGVGGTYSNTSCDHPYISQPGDTWASIAAAWGTSPAVLREYVNQGILNEGVTTPFPLGTAITIPNISGRFTSRQRFNMGLGWSAARVKFPKSVAQTSGLSWFPAVWQLYVAYNQLPGNYLEIDMMEMFGDSTKYNTHVYLHKNPMTTLQDELPVPNGVNAGDDFHTYWMLRTADEIQIGVDSLIMGAWTSANVPAGVWPDTQQSVYWIINFAMDPGYLAHPKASDFPAYMLVDWVWFKPLALL